MPGAKKSPKMAGKTLRLYFDIAKPYWKYGLFALAIAPVAEVMVRWIPPLLVADLLDRLEAGTVQDVRSVAPLLAWYIALPLISEAFLWRLCLWSMNRYDGLTMHALAHYVFKHLVERSSHFHNNSFAGALVAKANRFVNGFEPLYDTFIFEITTTITITIFTMAILWSRSPLAVVAFLGMAAIFIFVMYPLIRRQAAMNREKAAADSNQTAQLADSLSNIMTIKSFGHEQHEVRRYRTARDRLLKKQMRSWDFANLPGDLITSVTITFINSLALLSAVIAATSYNQNPSTIFLTVSFIGALTQKLWNLRRIFRRVEQIMSDSAEMTEILLQPNEVTDIANPKPFKPIGGAITFANVGFRYADARQKPLLSNFNLHIKPGEKVGLVGPSGGGKTTITKLLLRFMDIQEGTISIDGQDIAKIRQHDLRSHIAYVPQEPLLFHRSLAENIQYGRLNATDQEIRDAAAQAHAAEFIRDMPAGYDTLVGERGVKLSGGQRQRVAIARAMVKDAPVLVLDEATSALDSESEVLIQDALWRLMEGRTAIVIAHRLSTIQRMDRILVLKDGQVVEEGSHKALLARKGVYAELWTHQSGGFIDDEAEEEARLATQTA